MSYGKMKKKLKRLKFIEWHRKLLPLIILDNITNDIDVDKEYYR